MKQWYNPRIEELHMKATRNGLPDEDGDGGKWTLDDGADPPTELDAGPGNIHNS